MSSLGRQGRHRVLMVAFHYPPNLSSSGVLRSLKFSRYLPDFGWDPVVLTVRPQYYDHTDSELETQIPSQVQVIRTYALDSKKNLAIRGRYLRATALPDRFIGWLPFAFLAGTHAIREQKVEAIYTTSPLATAHLIGLALKRATNLPWIADFRDPWLEPELADRSSPLFRLENGLQRAVLRRADVLLFTTAQLRDYVLAQGVGKITHTVVIPNGYDEEDFTALPAISPDPLPIRIIHPGLVDAKYRSPQGLLHALSSLLAQGFIARNQVRVEFVGGGPYAQSEEFRELLARLALSDVVGVTPPITYAESLLQQAKSHILLLLQCGMDTTSLIPAKVFEYLRLGRPILAITPPGATTELLAATGGAEIVDPRDSRAICKALQTLLAKASHGSAEASVNHAVLAGYRRSELTKRLAVLLDEVVATPSANTR